MVALFRFVLPLGIALIAISATAAEMLSGPVPATVLDVVDGDTITVRARIWLGQAIETRVRLAGIDTPELRGRCDEERALAVRAREALQAYLSGHQVTLTDIRHGTYAGRVVARVSAGDRPDIAESLLTAGLARSYGGRGAASRLVRRLSSKSWHRTFVGRPSHTEIGRPLIEAQTVPGASGYSTMP